MLGTPHTFVCKLLKKHWVRLYTVWGGVQAHISDYHFAKLFEIPASSRFFFPDDCPFSGRDQSPSVSAQTGERLRVRAIVLIARDRPSACIDRV